MDLLGGHNLQHFLSQKNSCCVLLSYVIIKNATSPDDGHNRDVHINNQERTVGNMFTSESTKFLDIIRETNLGTDNETWIKGLKCIRKSMQEIQAHYDGTSKGAKSKNIDRDDVNKIFYNNDITFKFEKYVIKPKGIFNLLEKYGVPLY